MTVSLVDFPTVSTTVDFVSFNLQDGCVGDVTWVVGELGHTAEQTVIKHMSDLVLTLPTGNTQYNIDNAEGTQCEVGFTVIPYLNGEVDMTSTFVTL